MPDLLDYPWILPSAGTQMAERLRIIFRAHGLPPPEPVIETDIVSLKLELMRDSDYLSFHAAAHLREIDPGRFRPLDVPEATWRRAAGIITQRRSEPHPAAAVLIGIIETICLSACRPRIARAPPTDPKMPRAGGVSRKERPERNHTGHPRTGGRLTLQLFRGVVDRACLPRCASVG